METSPTSRSDGAGVPAGFDTLRDAGAAEGFRFLARLEADYLAGANRFDGAGETLIEVRRPGRLIGIGGLNRDPYSGLSGTGRIRHLYVAPPERRRGVGRLLMARLLQEARGHFRRVVLRTDTEAAARFYESLGFSRVLEVPGATHLLLLGPGERSRR